MPVRRGLRLAAALVAAALVAITAGNAQQAPAPGPTTAAAPAGDSQAPAPAATATTPAATGKTPASTSTPPQPPASAKPPAAGAGRGSTGGQSPERFEPTEKVRADFDVSFPVDI